MVSAINTTRKTATIYLPIFYALHIFFGSARNFSRQITKCSFYIQSFKIFFSLSISDLYQITMAYAYWKARRIEDRAVFDLFFRKSPFSGEFTIFAGLSECLKFLENFKYSESDIEYLRKTLPSNVEPDFYTYLANLTPKDITIHALQEGSIAFPRWV